MGLQSSLFAPMLLHTLFHYHAPSNALCYRPTLPCFGCLHPQVSDGPAQQPVERLGRLRLVAQPVTVLVPHLLAVCFLALTIRLRQVWEGGVRGRGRGGG